MAQQQQPFTISSLAAFMRAGDAVAFERLRDAHCAVCQTTAALGGVERMMACDQARCALRNPPDLRAERIWVRAVLSSGLVDNPDPPDAVLDGFNRHIGLAGCAMPALTRPAPGAPIRRGFTAPTLRGQLHALLVAVLAELGGDLLHENVSDRTQAELRQQSDQARRLWNLRQDDRIRLLAAGGLNPAEIARRTGQSRDRIRSALGKK